MEVEESPLQDELMRIFAAGARPVHARWQLEFQLPDDQGTVTPLKLFSIDIQRLYDRHYGDYVLVDVLFPLGTYNRRIVPNKERLTATLTRSPTGENEPEPEQSDEEIEARNYRAILTDEHSDVVAAASYMVQDEQSSNLADLARVQFQLLEPALEQLRLIEVGGIYRGDRGIDIIRHTLTEVSSQLELAEEDSVSGVTIVPADNQQPQSHVVLPHGTRAMDVPAAIQKEWGGVYNTGIGCYLQDGQWYVWPQFNIARFDSVPGNITFINLPQDRYTQVERTYRLSGRQVIALSTGEVSHQDYSHHEQLNQGNAVRFTNADRVFEGMGQTRGNKHTISRSQNNSEMSVIPRPNYNVSPVSEERITNNSFAQVSKLAARQGSVVTLTWENANPDLIYPGMPAKLLYLDDDEVKEVEGVVLRAHHFIHDTRQGIVVGNHITNSAVTLFLEKIE